MKKDNRTKSERISALKRADRRTRRARETAKNKYKRKETFRKEKENKDLAYQKHMIRLKQELGIA